MADLTMPSLGADMEAGTLVSWRVAPGHVVARGDVVCEVETDKGVIEVQTFSAGRVRDLLVSPGTRVPVGVVLAHLDDVTMQAIAGAEVAAAPPSATRSGAGPAVPVSTPDAGGPMSVAPAVVAPTSVGPTSVGPVSSGRGAAERSGSPSASDEPSTKVADSAVPVRVLASPYARARARELGVDLSVVVGTARHGAIHANDVERTALARAAQEVATPRATVTAESPRPTLPTPVPPSPADEAAARKARMRKAIAATVSRSKREVPHFYLASTVDLGPALAWLAEENAARPVEGRILPGALLLWAAAHAVRAVPELNGRWEGDHAETLAGVHLGVAISLRGGGLVAPAIFDADALSIGALMAALGDLSQRARAGGLRSAEMTGATISVTSLGERGAPTVFPIIFPPQVAMVGFGRIVERPWVVGGAVLPRSVVDVTLAADHRVVDGHRASLYLEAVGELLGHPEQSLAAAAPRTTETTR